MGTGSREENASKQKARASVAIQSERRLWSRCARRSRRKIGRGLSRRRRRAKPRGDAMLQLDPVACRYRQKIGGPPHHIVLELSNLAVGIDQFPHHLDDAQT